MPELTPAHASDLLLKSWESTWRARESEAAVLDTKGEIRFSFREIEAEAERMVTQWEALRPPRGIVAVKLGNSPYWPAVLVALLKLGAIVLPLGTDVSVPAWASATIGPDLKFESRTDAEQLPGISAAAVLVKLTSGTTGEPRAICFTAAQLAADCEHICETMGIGANDVNLAAIPISHSYGFSNLLTPLLLRGVGMAVTEDRFPRALLEAINRAGVTVFPGTPVLFQHLADVEAACPKSLRLCISAGAPLSPRVWQKFRERFGLGIHVFYGSSECGGIAYDRHGVVVEEGFVGQPMTGVSITPLDEDGPSQIQIRSAAVGERYCPIDEAEVLGNGRFVPGDLVRMTEGGLILAGRVSDFINVGGRKLNPAEVEQQIAGLAGIRNVVVFGVPSSARGEEPIAAVVGTGVDSAELLRSVARILPPWQVPRDVWVLDEWPVSERGKISRRTMAERYLAQRPGGN